MAVDSATRDALPVMAAELRGDDAEREELLAAAVVDAGRGYWKRQRAEQHPA
ncbi:hypothetical protein [Streptacidiphilus sp. EB103A]|uniref:hypothetical protein n=1 Tax=Streptacidiphilus sp. EB103A TaxID=3156275 RepID=UPI003517FA0B